MIQYQKPRREECQENLRKAVLAILNGSGRLKPAKSAKRSSLPSISVKTTVLPPVESEPIKEEKIWKTRPICLSGRSETKSISPGMRESSEKYCLYCGLRIGSVIRYKKRDRVLIFNLDHFRPVCRHKGRKDYNGKNLLIPSCQVCNKVKGNKLFDSFPEAKNYILDYLLSTDWKMLT
jgi:hypothetical protein